MAAYRINEDRTAWQPMDGEAVVLNTDTSAYYSLNHTGSRIFELLAAGPRSTAELTRDAVETFGVSPEVASAEIGRVLELLLQEDLILEATPDGDDATVSKPDGCVDDPGSWEPPSLTRHGELEQLVLSGE